MAYLASLLLVLQLSCVLGALSYNPEDYLEVYPDPTDPEVLRGRTPLHFALIQSLGGGPQSQQIDASGSIAGVKIALDRINNDNSLLPGYTLHYTFVESECNRTSSLNSFFSQILHQPRKLALLGSGCSVATEPAAEISRFYNISHISCVASSPQLQDRVRFPNYFQLNPSEDTLSLGFYGVIKEFGWRRVAIILQNENIFIDVVERLTDLLDKDGIEYNEKLFDSEDGIADLKDEPFDMESRIFIFAMYEVHARALLCEAYERDIRLPRYLLMTPGWYVPLWWTVADEGLNCTVEQRESVLPSTIGLLNSFFLEFRNPNLETTTGITSSDFITEQLPFLGIPPLNLTFSGISPFCYDATWTLAYALNQTLNSIADPALNAELAQAYNVTPPFGLEDFTYDSHRLLDVMFDHISKTDFDGVSGSVAFDDQGIRNFEQILVFQFRYTTDVTLKGVVVGSVLPAPVANDYNFVYVPPEDIESVWQGLVPYDGIPEKVIVTIHPALTAVASVLACAGIILSLGCLIFTFVYRKSMLIKLASPKLNYVIGLGAIMLYANVILFVVPSTDPNMVAVLCNLTNWLAAIGLSLCYGTILTKMARVYHIFNNPSAKKKGIHDWMLLLGVACLVSVDLIILITYTLVEDFYGVLGPELVENGENPDDLKGELGLITEYCFYLCHSVYRDIFLGVLYGYKMLLQVIALVLAFSIRKVKVKGLNDAKYVGASIYVTSIVLALIIVATHALLDYVNGSAALYSVCYLVGTTAVMILVFVPLMVELYKDPMGEEIFSKSNLSAAASAGVGTLGGKSEATTLKGKIKKLEVELEATKEQLSLFQPTNHTASVRVTTPSIHVESTLNALEESHMVTPEVANERKSSATIWDTPEELVMEENGSAVI